MEILILQILQSVAIPFKWGQVFQRIYQLHVALVKTSTSQSLLNEVKYSNAPAEHGSLFGHNVAIPFKWGQVFQLLWSTSGTTITANSSQSLLNEVKYSNLPEGVILTSEELKSQSLLNEVKYSNGRLCNLLIFNNFFGAFFVTYPKC